MPKLEPWLEENYRKLQEERGQSWEVLASDIESTDPNVAAWMREQGGGEGRSAEAPKRRGRPPKSQT